MGEHIRLVGVVSAGERRGRWLAHYFLERERELRGERGAIYRGGCWKVFYRVFGGPRSAFGLSIVPKSNACYKISK